MRVLGRIELIDLAIYADKTLILTDFHIGYEEALNKQGLMVPRFQFPEIVKRLEAIFSKLKNKKIKRIIINGDLKHEFGTISDQEWRNVLKLLDYFGRHCDKIILIKGNHDTIIGPIARKRNIKVARHYIIEPNKSASAKSMSPSICEQHQKQKQTDFEGVVPYGDEGRSSLKQSFIANLRRPRSEILQMQNKETIQKSLINNTQKSFKTIKTENNKNNPKNKILVIHGDKIPDKTILEGVSMIIIGHEHPAVSIRDGARTELFKAYLIGKWNEIDIIAQPSFNMVTEGTDMLKEEVLSPFLKGNLSNFEAVIVADKLYSFGKLKNLR